MAEGQALVLGLGWGARARITGAVPPFHFLLVLVFLLEIPFRILGCKQPRGGDLLARSQGGLLSWWEDFRCLRKIQGPGPPHQPGRESTVAFVQ